MYNSKDDSVRNLFIGIDNLIPISDNKKVIPINFDNAATTPVFKGVLREISKACEFYGAIGRGVGQKSEYSTRQYYKCKDYILDFFNAPKDKYSVIFVSNTTEGINRLSNILINNSEDIVILTRMEHHSNDLPWREKCDLKYVEVDKKGRLNLDNLQSLLEKYSGKVKYVSLTAASNVTGYINDINHIAKLVHSYGAKLIVDGAQIVAHKKISMASLNNDESIDFLVFSSHKIYAPFGSGAIIGLKDTFNKLDSDFKGGGTVDTVLDYSEVLFQTPEKNEAGSPNFFGAIALVQAMKEIENIGFDYIYNHERNLLKRTLDGLNSINGLQTYGDNINISDRLGIVIFNITGMYNDDVARYLATIRGIFVRQGAFCAHPYIKRLLCLTDEDACKHLIDPNFKMPGMVRASFGVYNTIEEVDIFLNTVEEISKLCK
ncbi:aminotransferase class V-fold PLP-dependent enzyme [Clostridium sp.]|uniref:aminotransferase class V-fold PLP-dependent enzyme n=1 Tax=Clostridium sp. TaxID=1506 RepID=UPI00260BDC6B|nr:aminotransferase class V-fold PLP-dependent enzyme [Clostridium sp.]